MGLVLSLSFNFRRLFRVPYPPVASGSEVMTAVTDFRAICAIFTGGAEFCALYVLFARGEDGMFDDVDSRCGLGDFETSNQGRNVDQSAASAGDGKG